MIPHNRPTLGPPETDAARRVIESGWPAQGREVAAFEREICAALELEDGHAVAFSSGTAALFMALWVLGAGGRRVAMPVYSCAALRNAILMAQATPVAIDIADGTPNIDLDQAARAAADMAIAAHLFGMPQRIGRAAMPIVEDCAQALGARIDGRPVGLNGTVGVFSFYATKMITTGGQGGMLVSRDRTLVDAVRDYREFDCRHDRKPRFNFQMTDLQAAIGRAQLAGLDQFIAQRHEIRECYRAVGLPLWLGPADAGIAPCPYRAIVRTSRPDRLISRLEAGGVRAIVPIETWELMGDSADFPQAAALARSTVSLPCYPSLPMADARRIAAIAHAAFQEELPA